MGTAIVGIMRCSLVANLARAMILFLVTSPTTSALPRVPTDHASSGLCGPNDNKDDCRALLDLYQATGPPKIPGFANGSSLCGWTGVRCDNTTHRVTELFVAEDTLPKVPTGDKFLQGTIPESIGLLTSLTNLQLDNNNLTGSIPNSIGSLTNLIYLYLQGNRLSGAVPGSIGKLKKLTHLFLNGNQLTSWDPSSGAQICENPKLQLSNFGECFLEQNPFVCPMPACARGCEAECTQHPTPVK